jgi:hypothetical protein
VASPTLCQRIKKIEEEEEVALPIQNLSSFQRHFGSYANLPFNPAYVRFPDAPEDDSPVEEVSTENNTDIEKEECKFVQEQRHLIHS